MRGVRLLRRAVTTGIVVLIGGCAGASNAPPAGLPAQLGATIVENALLPLASGWAIRGNARVSEIPGSSDMAIQVDGTGLTPGAHAWHIHNGGCQNPGMVIVPFSATATEPGVDTSIMVDGSGEVLADARIPSRRLTRAQLQAGQFSVHIHNGDGANPGPSVACANL